MNNHLCDLKVGCNHEVDVTHINDPHSFFVRPITVRNLMESIEKPGISLISTETVKLGQHVVYRSKRLRKFVRGEICFININGERVKCDIYAIDYGCLDKSVPRKHIYIPDAKANSLNEYPGLAYHCRLYLCEPIGEIFSDKVINTMKTFIGEYTATITIMSKMNDQLIVELRTMDSPREIATMLALIHLTTLTKGSNVINRFANTSALNYSQKLQFQHKEVNIGDILHVRVQSGTSVSGFYVADINDFKILRSAGADFSMYCKTQFMKAEDVVPGRPCAVKVENLDQYQRAIIKEIKDANSRAVLQLVDWGIEIESNFSCIRSIDKELYLTQPIIAIYCSTSEDQIWETGLPSFFFKGYELGIKIMELGNNVDKPHKVNIYPVKMLKY